MGISSYYGGHCAALEIKGDTVTALYCDNDNDSGFTHDRGSQPGKKKLTFVTQERVDLTPPDRPNKQPKRPAHHENHDEL